MRKWKVIGRHIGEKAEGAHRTKPEDGRCEIRGCEAAIEWQLLRPPDRGSTGIKVCRKCMDELVAVDGFVYVGEASA